MIQFFILPKAGIYSIYSIFFLAVLKPLFRSSLAFLLAFLSPDLSAESLAKNISLTVGLNEGFWLGNVFNLLPFYHIVDAEDDVQ